VGRARNPDPFATLLAAAQTARRRAHAPYSGFRVGAALRTRSGKTYLGCNVENVTHGLTLCAERVALFAALSDGEREFEAMAVVVPDGAPALPCGICREMLKEFAPEIRLVLADGAGGYRVETVDRLLPAADAPAAPAEPGG
jgi:cytidine deaminase